MLSDYFKCFVSPKELAHNVHNYTKDGLVVWKALSFKNFKFILRDHLEHATAIQTYMKDVDKAVMLEVNYGQHWVVAIRKTLFGNDYVVADPWTGKKCLAKATYHNVTGAAYFERI